MFQIVDTKLLAAGSPICVSEPRIGRGAVFRLTKDRPRLIGDAPSFTLNPFTGARFFPPIVAAVLFIELTSVVTHDALGGSAVLSSPRSQPAGGRKADGVPHAVGALLPDIDRFVVRVAVVLHIAAVSQFVSESILQFLIAPFGSMTRPHIYVHAEN